MTIRKLLILLPVVLVCGCTALRETMALHQVGFSFDHISDVRVAGVSTTGKASYSDVSITDVAKLAAALLSHDVPTTFTVHVRAENPSSNSVTARMIKLGWTFFLEDRKVLDGRLDQAYAFAPGKPVDVAIPLTFNAYELYQHSAQDLFELGLAIAGVPGYAKEVRVDLMPTVDTDLGPIQYPEPIIVKRTVSGS